MGRASLAKEKLGRTVLQIVVKHMTAIVLTMTAIINHHQQHLVMAIFIIEKREYIDTMGIFDSVHRLKNAETICERVPFSKCTRCGSTPSSYRMP